MSTLPSDFYCPKCDKALALNKKLYHFLFRSHLPTQYKNHINKDVILQKKAKQMQENNKTKQKSFFSNFSFSKFFGKKSNHSSEYIEFNDETEDIEDDEFFLVNRSDNPKIQEINPFGKFFLEEFYLDLFKNSIKLQEYLHPYITTI